MYSIITPEKTMTYFEFEIATYTELFSEMSHLNTFDIIVEIQKRWTTSLHNPNRIIKSVDEDFCDKYSNLIFKKLN